MHDITNASNHEQLLRAELHKVDALQPRHLLAQILRTARNRQVQTWAIAFTAAAGAALILAGLLLLTWGQEQHNPAPNPSTSTRPWRA